MQGETRDYRKVFIALIVAMAIICGLLIGAIIGVVINKNNSTSYEELVTDAFCEMSKGVEKDYCFHIPKINKQSEEIERINNRIYNTLYDRYTQPGETEMYYKWEKKNDAVSIVVEASDIETQKTDYYVFNVDVKEEKELTAEELLTEVGIAEDDFFNNVKDAVGRYSDHEKQYFSVEEQEANINSIIDNTLSNSSINQAIPYISGGEINAVVYVFSAGFSEPVLQMLDIVNARAEEHLHCDGNHEEILPEDFTGKSENPDTTEEELQTAEETTAAAENEENMLPTDILTKYYWDQTINDRCIIRFFEDGTYKAYYYPDDFSSDFFPELLDEIETEGYYTYEIKNNKLYLKQQFGNQVNSTQYEWLDINSARILDTWVKERCKNAENIFYDTSWHPDNDEFYETAYYLKNTGWVTDENYYKTDKSESEEADIYTGFLLNEGYNEFWAYKHCKTPDSLNVESLLYDFDSDGTKELFLSAYDKDMPSYRGQTLYTIRNGKVETLLLENQEFATMGYTMLRLKYDNVKKIPVVEKFSVRKDSSAATFSKSTMDFYTAENGFSEPVINYETTWLQHNEPHGYYTEDIEKVKAETDLHYIEDKYFKFYKIDGEYVEDTRFKEYDTRYTTPDSPELTLTEGTYKKPIK